MTIGSGNSILATDYNTIQTIVSTVLGTGSGQSGYGQAVSSSQVAAGNNITASQMQNLKTDLDKISYHQTNAASTAPSVSVGGSITASDWSTYNSQATTLQTNKFTLSSAQATETVGVNPTFTNWNNTRTHTVTVAFGSADAARYFFNSGSQIKIIPNQTGYTSSVSKGGRWAAIFTTVTFNYANWAAMTGSDQQIYIATDTGTYSGNVFRVLARADTSNLYLSMIFADTGLTGNIDENVDGTTTSTVSHYRATGSYVSVTAPTVTTTSGP
jgi:hypothetical protein